MNAQPNVRQGRTLSVLLALAVLMLALASAGVAVAASTFTMDTFPNWPNPPGIAVQEGDTVVLTWQSTELEPNSVAVRYFPNGPGTTPVQTLASGLPVNGSYAMTVPNGPTANGWVALRATRIAANGGGTIWVNNSQGAGYLTVSAATPGTGAPPTTIDPVFGTSTFFYQDLQDSSAKREGGYAAFDDTEFAGDYDNPHGGYDTSTNKCKVCHAVHRAEGAYYLLRADSQDDACDYCHIGGSAHSSLVVYDNGKYTMNGHTIGASTAIPDSTVEQWTETVTISSVDSAMNPISEDIHVRAYDAEKAEMFRFSRHHGHGATGTGRSGWKKVGPLALRCMNCHQVHNATNQVWRPAETIVASAAVGPQGDGYKLLKLFPSGSTTGTINAYDLYDVDEAVKVPEATLTAGVNFSQHESAEFTYTEAFGTSQAYAAPIWVAQHIGPEAGLEHGADRDAWSVSEGALSVWCADCHNLNIGGWEELADVELGFKAHTERTHPAPYTGAYSGPGQCYSCHRSEGLAPVMGGTFDGTTFPVNGSLNAGRNGCTQCHYGTQDYYQNRMNPATAVDSDFPHSANGDSIKLLGGYSIGASPTTIDTSTVITESNLDAVCLRCHGGIGVNH